MDGFTKKKRWEKSEVVADEHETNLVVMEAYSLKDHKSQLILYSVTPATSLRRIIHHHMSVRIFFNAHYYYERITSTYFPCLLLFFSLSVTSHEKD